jgi:hypothetical protein
MLTSADVCDVLARQKQPLTWLEGIAHELAKVRPHALVFFFLKPAHTSKLQASYMRRPIAIFHSRLIS